MEVIQGVIMPINVRSHGDVNSSIKGVRSFGDQSEEEIEKSPETLGEASKRTGKSTLIKSVENAQSIGGLAKSGLLGLGSLFGMEDPHARLLREGKISKEQAEIPDFAKLLQNKLGVSDEELPPKNPLENFVQRFGSQALLSGLLGGVPGLISTGVGSAVAAGSGALGAPEGIQDLVQLTGEIATPIGVRNIPSVKKALAAGEINPTVSKYLGKFPTVVEHQKSLYDKVEKLAGKKESTILPIQKALNSISSKLSKATSKKIGEEVGYSLGVIDNHLGNIKKGKVKDALEFRRNLSKTYNTASDAVKPYIKELRDSFNDFFAVYGAKRPTFLKALDKADRFTEYKHMATYLDKFISKLQLGKLPGGELATDTINFVIKGLEKGATGFAFNSAARKYLTKAVLSANKDNPALFMKNIENLRNVLPTEE